MAAIKYLQMMLKNTKTSIALKMLDCAQSVANAKVAQSINNNNNNTTFV